jgi:hypothetical protein
MGSPCVACHMRIVTTSLSTGLSRVDVAARRNRTLAALWTLMRPVLLFLAISGVLCANIVVFGGIPYVVIKAAGDPHTIVMVKVIAVTVAVLVGVRTGVLVCRDAAHGELDIARCAAMLGLILAALGVPMI